MGNAVATIVVFRATIKRVNYVVIELEYARFHEQSLSEKVFCGSAVAALSGCCTSLRFVRYSEKKEKSK